VSRPTQGTALYNALSVYGAITPYGTPFQNASTSDYCKLWQPYNPDIAETISV
jgi:hypothetical protein